MHNLIHLWRMIKPMIGLKCSHELELQRVQWEINDGRFVSSIGDNMKHRCEYCGKLGIVLSGRLSTPYP